MVGMAQKDVSHLCTPPSNLPQGLGPSPLPLPRKGWTALRASFIAGWIAQTYVGDEAQTKRGVLSLTRPVEQVEARAPHLRGTSSPASMPASMPAAASVLLDDGQRVYWRYARSYTRHTCILSKVMWHVTGSLRELG